jgi:hypothetical protein
MYIRSISPIIASILIIVITVAIAGIFYAFTSGIFGSLSSSSNNLVNQQSQIVSFTINTIYCSNNILYFNIYNKGNIPININNSIIIFTDNYGNTISINGSNIICNNGNIINIGSNSLCYIINNICYYNYVDYIKSINFIYNGINYNYEILNNNKFNLLYAPNNSISNSTSGSSTNTTSISSGYIPTTIYNTQNIPTPSPFQQDIAICNGSINIGNNFAYINNVTLFNQINPNGQNVYFSMTAEGSPNIYSWYEGQLNYNGVYCDVWWINLPNGIPANSNVTIYMYVGNSSSNYYSLYYPYVGTNEQVIGTMQYDNGQDVFIAYGYFDNTFDGWSGYNSGSQTIYYPQATPYGIEMLNNQIEEGTYILPPNNWNIPKIPLIVEEAWYYTLVASGNAISLFGNTSQQNFWEFYFTGAPTSQTSIWVEFVSQTLPEENISWLAYTDITARTYSNSTYFPISEGTVYSYLIVNSSYTQAGYYMYNTNQVWAPLTLLDMYPLSYNPNYGNYTYLSLDFYSPFIWGDNTLEISAGTGGIGGFGVYQISYQYIEWVVARAYPPNGVMPSIYIG